MMFRQAIMTVVPILPACISFTDEPAPGFFTSRPESRRLICDQSTFAELRKQHPGLIDDARPRGDFADRTASRCEEVVMGEGERHPRDRALLDTLAATMAEIAEQVASTRNTLSKRTWLVEAHYPSASVAAKIVFAAKTALVERGLTVTDRSPQLAVGDIDVIARLSPLTAHPIACRRYYANGSMNGDDGLLALLLLDDLETSLHAATCENGRWIWLR